MGEVCCKRTHHTHTLSLTHTQPNPPYAYMTDNAILQYSVRTHTHIRTHTCTHTYTNIDTHMHTHTCTHTHTILTHTPTTLSCSTVWEHPYTHTYNICGHTQTAHTHKHTHITSTCTHTSTHTHRHTHIHTQAPPQTHNKHPHTPTLTQTHMHTTCCSHEGQGHSAVQGENTLTHTRHTHLHTLLNTKCTQLQCELTSQSYFCNMLHSLWRWQTQAKHWTFRVLMKNSSGPHMRSRVYQVMEEKKVWPTYFSAVKSTSCLQQLHLCLWWMFRLRNAMVKMNPLVAFYSRWIRTAASLWWLTRCLTPSAWGSWYLRVHHTSTRSRLSRFGFLSLQGKKDFRTYLHRRLWKLQGVGSPGAVTLSGFSF